MTVVDELHRMTVDEYVHIVRDLGWESTELIEGVVYDVTPEYNHHAVTVRNVSLALNAHVGRDMTLWAGSVRLSQFSMVEPDVYVVEADAEFDRAGAVPGSMVKLVVEVSVSSHSRDRGRKLIAYAKAGVPEVWLIDPRPGVGELVRHRDPDGASFATVDRFAVGEDANDLDVAAILTH